MASKTLIVNPSQMQAMKKFYEKDLDGVAPYSEFRAKKNGVTITAYTSGKVLFQGNNLDREVGRWLDQGVQAAEKKEKKKEQEHSALPPNFDQMTIIGSDEVGTGSYFGPLVVCAVYLGPEQMDLVKEYGVKDSKLLSDTQIQEIAWQLRQTVSYHLTVCPPVKYNEVIGNRRYNANSIKVSLHNFAIQALYHKLTPSQKEALDLVFIDQFTKPDTYYRHLKKEKHPYPGKILFETKGESKHLAVACASIIARDAFLKSLKELGQPYQQTLPSGAGPDVDQFASRLIKQYGRKALEQTAKVHFANTDKALRLANKS